MDLLKILLGNFMKMQYHQLWCNITNYRGPQRWQQ